MLCITTAEFVLVAGLVWLTATIDVPAFSILF